MCLVKDNFKNSPNVGIVTIVSRSPERCRRCPRRRSGKCLALAPNPQVSADFNYFQPSSMHPSFQRVGQRVEDDIKRNEEQQNDSLVKPAQSSSTLERLLKGCWISCGFRYAIGGRNGADKDWHSGSPSDQQEERALIARMDGIDDATFAILISDANATFIHCALYLTVHSMFFIHYLLLIAYLQLVATYELWSERDFFHIRLNKISIFSRASPFDRFLRTAPLVRTGWFFERGSNHY